MNRAPRVGLDYRPALANREGIGRYTRELVRGLIAQGHGRSLALFATTLSPARFDDDELGLSREGVLRVRWRLPSKALRLAMTVTRSGADTWLGGVDLFHHTQPNTLRVRRAREVATVFDCIFLERRGWLDPRGAERMEAAVREQVRRSALILTPTQFVAREVVERLGADAARVAVTPLGADHGPVLPQSPSTSAPYILTVSRVDARKNHLRMLQAFEQLVAAGLPHRWIVAGPAGHGAEDFDAAVARSSARDRVERRSFVSEDELAKLYAGASAFVFASLAEGFGLPPLEAMARRVPVVVARATCLPEVCGDAAEYVEPTEVDSIAQGLRRVLEDPAHADELRARGRRRAEIFTWSDCARTTLAAYLRAIG